MRYAEFMLAAAAALLAFVAAPFAMAEDPNRVASQAELEVLGIVETAAVAPPPIAPASGEWSWHYGPYRYDGSGNIASIGTQMFLYDTRGRLVDATIRPAEGGEERQTYVYDAFGNMTTRSGPGAQAVSAATSPTTNHLTAMNAQYDAAGNLTQWQAPGETNTYRYTYDGLNALSEMKRTNVAAPNGYLHVYTADEERIWTYDRAANVSHWKIRDLGGRVLRDYVNSGTAWSLSRDYIYRDGALLAAVTPAETLHFSLDHLGTPRVITNDAKVRVGFHHYYPFGAEWLIDSAQEGESLKFTGHERDADPAGSANELDYMHARYYSAQAGRFLSVDPDTELKNTPPNPQMWNRYAYVMNNPIRYVDPDGRLVQLGGTKDEKQKLLELIQQNLVKKDRHLVTLGKNGMLQIAANAQGSTIAFTMLKGAVRNTSRTIGVAFAQTAVIKPGPGPVKPMKIDLQTTGGGLTARKSMTMSGNIEVWIDPRGNPRGQPLSIVVGHELLGHGWDLMFVGTSSEHSATLTENYIRRDLGMPLRLPVPNDPER